MDDFFSDSLPYQGEARELNRTTNIALECKTCLLNIFKDIVSVL